MSQIRFPFPLGKGLGVRFLCREIENSLDYRRHARGRSRDRDQFAPIRYHLEQRSVLGDLGVQRARVAVAQTFLGGGIDDEFRHADERVAKIDHAGLRRVGIEGLEEVS